MLYFLFLSPEFPVNKQISFQECFFDSYVLVSWLKISSFCTEKHFILIVQYLREVLGLLFLLTNCHHV